MLVDEATITVTAGHGGPGKVAFFPFKSGPCGGNGGCGGSVYAVLNPRLSDLSRYAGKHDWAAEAGQTGERFRRTGADGEDLFLNLPRGTTIKDIDTGEELEVMSTDMQILLATGGIGGRGNDAFKSSTNQTPRHAEPGRPGQERHLQLILKLIADVGLIGLPNAGKSSLLNELTAARVKTADYPFTTLEPNLGAFDNKIIADIPGLIAGASQGRGLGIKFLKHIEKVGLLLHCISCESADPRRDYEVVRTELGHFNAELLHKPEIILLTKHDLVDANTRKAKLAALTSTGRAVLSVSIYDWDSLQVIKNIISTH